jgi:hypothetical protein
VVFFASSSVALREIVTGWVGLLSSLLPAQPLSAATAMTKASAIKYNLFIYKPASMCC